MIKARIYLDNCCYNRPYDNQSLKAISLEAEAKLYVQVKKASRLKEISVINPVDFILLWEEK